MAVFYTSGTVSADGTFSDWFGVLRGRLMLILGGTWSGTVSLRLRHRLDTSNVVVSDTFTSAGAHVIDIPSEESELSVGSGTGDFSCGTLEWCASR